MSLQWATRAGVLRYLHRADALPRMTGLQIQLRQLSLAATPRSVTSLVGSITLASSQQSCSYATKTSRAKAKSSTNSTEGKRKTKRPLTEKQQEDKKKREKRAHIQQLKETALTAPKKLPQIAFSLAVQAKYSEVKGQHQEPKEAFKTVVSIAQSLSPEERERFQNQAEENRTANEASYAAWVKSHTPSQIRDANIARRSLARILNKPYRPIKDERLVKRPITAYLLYCKERNATGDFKHMAVSDATARTTEEWKGMTESEKSHYYNLAAQDRERYIREYQEVYGEDPYILSRKSRGSKSS